MIRLALLADPHLHDCSWRPTGSGLPGALRSYRETRASTRVFNESAPAFRAALEAALSAGARLAILAGDLTDDGQGPNIDAAMALLAEYRQRGLRVFATVGNHDLYALTGRPQRKEFLSSAGARVPVDSALCPEARTLGTAPALQRMEMLGYMPDPLDLHWETPFGTRPDWPSRSYDVPSRDGRTSCRMIDASYLVEPVPGLWLLSLDANVCVPRDGATDFSDHGAFHDPTDAGWSAVLRHRAHLLPWMTDVAARAKAAGKVLIAMSHYPVLDALAGTSAAEVALFGQTGLARRAPLPEVATALAATGIGLHFSGHLHVNDIGLHADAGGRIINVALPSPVAFPPAVKLAEITGQTLRLTTLPLAVVPGHDLAFAAYRAEARQDGAAPPEATEAPDHGAFMDRHLQDLVSARYIAREWPEDMAALARNGRIGDLRRLLGQPAGPGDDLPLMTLACDWYRLRKGGDAAHPYVPAERLRIYRGLCDSLPDAPGLAGQYTRFLRILKSHLTRIPTDGVVIDLATRTLHPGSSP